jgi:two-component system chemotaxis response regulator CheB
VVIGVSTGGPKALGEILPELSSNVNLPIFIVQHMPKGFTQALAESLDKKCSKSVVEAHDNDIVRNDHIYFAPGGKHLVLRKNSAAQIITCLNEDPPQAGCRPSADVLFWSAKDIYKGNLVALILTGMGNDGTNGLAALKQAGAVVIAQDKESSVVWGMPGSAVEAGYVDKILPLNQIPCAVKNIISNKLTS